MDGSSLKDRRRKRDGAIDEPTTRPPSKSMKKGADFSTPGHQNDVIDVSDDEAERHSAESSVKREAEPARPSEMQLRQELIMVKRHSLDLEHKLLNMEQQVVMKDDMLKRERRATREAELRADRAEKLLSSNGGLRDEQKEKELEKVADLTNQLEEERQKVIELTIQIEKEREGAKAKVERLKNKLKNAIAEHRFSSKSQKITAGGAEETNSMIQTIAHDHNILFLLNSSAMNAMSIDEAVEKVRIEFEKCGEETKKRLEKKLARYDCDVCNVKMPNKLVVTTHFLSEEHIDKVRSHNASVSLRAVKSWAVTLVQIQRDSVKQ